MTAAQPPDGWNSANPPGQPPNLSYRSSLHRSRRSTGAPIAVLLLLGLIAAAIVLVIGVSDPAGVLIAVPSSCAAVAAVVSALLWLDRWEPEPTRLLLLAFLWGASVAVIISLILELWTGAVLGDGVVLRFVGPLIEEGAKGAFLLVMLTGNRRREFDGVVDGLVYAGLTAIGFAFVEDVGYITASFNSGATAGISTIVLRCIISPFAHPLFTSMTGIGVGLMVSRPASPGRWIPPLVGFAAAVGLHSLWNSSLSFGFGAYVLVYVVIMVPAFALAIGVGVWSRRRERDVIARQLPAMVHFGWVTPAEAGWLASLSARKAWLAAVENRSGKSGRRALRDFQIAATELAFLRDKAERGISWGSAYADHNELVNALALARARATGTLRQGPAPTESIAAAPPAWLRTGA